MSKPKSEILQELGISKSEYETRPVADDYVPNDREAMFIYNYVELGMSQLESQKNAGYTSTSSVDASRRCKRLAPLIDKAIRNRMSGGAAVALNVLYNVMTDTGVSPSVRVKASTEWLDRSGYGKSVDVKFDDVTKQLEDYSKEELEEKLRKKAGKFIQAIAPGANIVDITDVVDGEVVGSE